MGTQFFFYCIKIFTLQGGGRVDIWIKLQPKFTVQFKVQWKQNRQTKLLSAIK